MLTARTGAAEPICRVEVRVDIGRAVLDTDLRPVVLVQLDQVFTGCRHARCCLAFAHHARPTRDRPGLGLLARLRPCVGEDGVVERLLVFGDGHADDVRLALGHAGDVTCSTPLPPKPRFAGVRQDLPIRGWSKPRLRSRERRQEVTRSRL